MKSLKSSIYFRKFLFTPVGKEHMSSLKDRLVSVSVFVFLVGREHMDCLKLSIQNKERRARRLGKNI